VQPPFKIWCERAIPERFMPLLEGAVVVDKCPTRMPSWPARAYDMTRPCSGSGRR